MNFAAALAFASFVAAPVPKDPVREAQASLQGDWKVIQCVADGEKRAVEAIEDYYFTATFKDSELALYPAEGGTIRGTFAVNPRAIPNTIDFESTETPALCLRGIYQHEGQKLTICFGMDGQPRPEAFKSETGGKTCLLVLERVKK